MLPALLRLVLLLAASGQPEVLVRSKVLLTSAFCIHFCVMSPLVRPGARTLLCPWCIEPIFSNLKERMMSRPRLYRLPVAQTGWRVKAYALPREEARSRASTQAAGLSRAF